MNALEPLDEQAEEVPVTALLAQRALNVEADALDGAAARVVRDCVLDWLGVTLAAARDPLVDILVDVAGEEGGRPVATLVGRAQRVAPLQAALINGAASHALDYDDINLSIPGHPSAAILPALLALGQTTRASGRELLAAFASGYETMCAIGLLVGPSHYAQGFHATATLGTFGAAAACARLLRLSPLQTCRAFGMAGTLASGLQSMFGTMAKPFHAGRAAQNGLHAALLARRGFVSRADVLECEQGFAQVASVDFDPQRALAPPRGGWHLLDNLFKLHAACFGVHAPMECAARIRAQHAPATERIVYIALRVGEMCDAICNIPAPRDGLEAKFSLRAAVAFGLRGLDTGDLATFCAEQVLDPRTVELCERVQVEFVAGWSASRCEMSVVLGDGAMLTARYDCGAPLDDKHAQSALVHEKFRKLAVPVLGEARSEAIAAHVDAFESLGDVSELLALCETGQA